MIIPLTCSHKIKRVTCFLVAMVLEFEHVIVRSDNITVKLSLNLHLQRQLYYVYQCELTWQYCPIVFKF